MIEYLIAAMVVFALVILISTVGYFVKRQPLKGSCGGLNTVMMEKGVEFACDMCGSTDPNVCLDTKNDKQV